MKCTARYEINKRYAYSCFFCFFWQRKIQTPHEVFGLDTRTSLEPDVFVLALSSIRLAVTIPGDYHLG